MKINFGRLFYCCVLVFMAMALGGYFNNLGLTSWYPDTIKPIGTPPNVVFPVVWTILYTLMALAFYFALENAPTDKERKTLNSWFICLMFLHILWNYAFFYTGLIGMALIVLVVIDILSYMTMMSFWGFSKVSALLFFPYFVWILFATYLNATFINLNGYIMVVE